MKLTAKKREIIGKKVKNLRNQGISPASVYGPKRASTNIQIDKKDFIKIFKTVGFNKFFDLVVDESNPVKVLVKDVDISPLSHTLLDVSFYQIDEESKITVEVPITFISEAPAVKQNLGFLVTNFEAIKVHCLPKDLPSGFEIDLSALENVGDTILIEQIKLSEEVEFDSSIDPTSAIVYIAAAQKEEVEETPVTEAVEGAEGTTAEGGEAATTETKSA